MHAKIRKSNFKDILCWWYYWQYTSLLVVIKPYIAAKLVRKSVADPIGGSRGLSTPLALMTSLKDRI